jgi:hypothetical protein
MQELLKTVEREYKRFRNGEVGDGEPLGDDLPDDLSLSVQSQP